MKRVCNTYGRRGLVDRPAVLGGLQIAVRRGDDADLDLGEQHDVIAARLVVAAGRTVTPARARPATTSARAARDRMASRRPQLGHPERKRRTQVLPDVVRRDAQPERREAEAELVGDVRR